MRIFIRVLHYSMVIRRTQTSQNKATDVSCNYVRLGIVGNEECWNREKNTIVIAYNYSKYNNLS